MGSRWIRIAGVLAGVVLLALSISITAISSLGHKADNLENKLSSETTQQATVINEYFEQARTAALLTSYNPSFDDYFEQQLQAKRGKAPSAITAARTSENVNVALLNLANLYPKRIASASFVDSNGAEVARVTDGKLVAQPASPPDKKTSPFFNSTMSIAQGHVLQTVPYLSPDSKQWVISHSTLINDKEGNVGGVLQFETTVESLRAESATTTRRYDASIVDAKTGTVLINSRTPQLSDAALGLPDETSSRPVVELHESTGFFTVDNHRSAYRDLILSPSNANDWVIVVTSDRQTASWQNGLGLAPIAMFGAALILLIVGAGSLRRYQLALQRAGSHDALTGTPNRTVLSNKIAKAIESAKRKDRAAAVLLVDLDDFKQVNDTLGHHFGDVLLKQVSDRLASIAGQSATIARLGSDEFAVLLPDVDGADGALEVADRFLNSLLDSFVLDEVVVSVEASIGIAIAPRHGEDAETLLRCADIAMYEAKTLRRGTTVFDPRFDKSAPTSLAMLGELRSAIDHGELVLHYQPKVDLQTNELDGVEALVRWQHPKRGLILPAEFLGLAERTALIPKLTIRVLEMALRQCRTWLEAGHQIPVAVNVSARSLSDVNFSGLILRMLAEHGVPPSLLRLELTESAIMADPSRATHLLERLHGADIAISVDDFGTGYSSMMYLKQLPVDELKVDRAFVKNMADDKSDGILVRSAVDLAHNLGLRVVAEGVEDAATLDALREIGCDLAQGYHLGRPMTATALDEWTRVHIANNSEASPRRHMNRFGLPESQPVSDR